MASARSKAACEPPFIQLLHELHTRMSPTTSGAQTTLKPLTNEHRANPISKT
jgi:hypothetical protein